MQQRALSLWRARHWIPASILLLTVYLLAPLNDSFAADSSVAHKIPAEKKTSFIKQVTARLGIPENSRFYNQIAEELERNIDNNQGNGGMEVVDPIPTKSQIIAHRSGQFGIPFPSEDELAVPELMPSQEMVEQIVRQQIANMQRAADEQIRIPELPDCRESKMESQPSPNANQYPDDLVFMDMLFVRKGEMPADAEQIYGKNVMIREYDPADHASLVAKTARFKCLPSRVRVTGKTVYHMEGLDAWSAFKYLQRLERK